MPRRSQLVCQQLENISSEALEKYQDIIRHYIRGRNGVYALYNADKLYYVGLATSLGGRLKNHLKNRHRGLWDRFSVYLTIGDAHLKEMESLLLRIAKPQGNKQIGRFIKCENLQKRFGAEVRGLLREELYGILGRSVSVKGERDDLRSKKDQAVLAPYMNGKPMRLKGRYKGELYRARVRNNGVIRVGRKLYNSPSLAAMSIKGRPTNGWWFWMYERAPGDWVRLRELRER